MKNSIANLRIKASGTRWLIREATSIEAACRAIAEARVSGSIGQKDILDERLMGGDLVVQADVVKLNSDNTERQPYQTAY